MVLDPVEQSVCKDPWTPVECSCPKLLDELKAENVHSLVCGAAAGNPEQTVGDLVSEYRHEFKSHFGLFCYWLRFVICVSPGSFFQIAVLVHMVSLLRIKSKQGHMLLDAHEE